MEKMKNGRGKSTKKAEDFFFFFWLVTFRKPLKDFGCTKIEISTRKKLKSHWVTAELHASYISGAQCLTHVVQNESTHKMEASLIRPKAPIHGHV